MKGGAWAVSCLCIRYRPCTFFRSPQIYTEMIRKRAYEIFRERGDGTSDEIQDWLQAERELNHHFGLTLPT